tara:strand:+ start:138 stop:491 length:354 start_codon:yes stop_codon:yes gene_type:complete
MKSLNNLRSFKDVLVGLPQDPAMILVLCFVGLPICLCIIYLIDMYGISVYGISIIDNTIQYYFPIEVKVQIPNLPMEVVVVESDVPKVQKVSKVSTFIGIVGSFAIAAIIIITVFGK